MGGDLVDRYPDLVWLGGGRMDNQGAAVVVLFVVAVVVLALGWAAVLLGGD